MEKLKCEQCDYYSIYRKNLKKHTERKHPNAFIHTCMECSFVTFSVTSLTIHQTIHDKSEMSKTKRQFKCTQCESIYYNRSNLIRHIRIIHTKTCRPELKCDICPFVGYYPRELTRHIQTHYKIGEKKYKCSKCKYQSSEKRLFLRHKRFFHDTIKKYACSYCAYAGAKKESLDIHIKRRHKMKQLFRCRKCEFKGENSRQLYKHMCDKHFNDTGFTCSFCDYATFSINRFNNHITKCDNLKYYSCNHCTHLARTETALSEHIEREHIKDENAKSKCIILCHKCGFKANDNHQLYLHMQNSISVFTCSKCAYATYNRTRLIHHINKLHNFLSDSIVESEKRIDFEKESEMLSILIEINRRSDSIIIQDKSELISKSDQISEQNNEDKKEDSDRDSDIVYAISIMEEITPLIY